MPSQPDTTGLFRSPGFLISVVLAVLVAILLIHERRAGQEWGGDFALYISHARNLSEGRAYADTGYIMNPYNRVVSPNTYPPLFPLVLAPIYARFGLDYKVLEMPGILCFAASIPLLFCLFRRDLPWLEALLASFLWAVWPFILFFKDGVIPDLMFVLLWVLALWMLRVAYDEPAARQSTGRAVLAGAAMFAVYATRSAGIVLPCAAVAYDLLRNRRLSPFMLRAAGAFGVLFVLQNVLIHNDTSYVQMFAPAPIATAKIYLYSLSTILSSTSTGWFRHVREVATAAAVLLAGAGYMAGLRRFRSPTELAIAFYLILLLLWSPGAGTRYMVPLAPFFFFYVVSGFGACSRAMGRRAGFALEAAVVSLILICFVSEDLKFQPSPIEGGISTPGFAELCRYIDTQTKPSDVFVFQKPRVLSLYTRRPSSIYPKDGDPDLVLKYSRSIHARYFVVTDALSEDAAVLRPFVRANSDHLRMVFSNPNFQLYTFTD